jgi:hypothetical protein
MSRERIYPWIGSGAIAVLCWRIALPAIYQAVVDRLVDPIITVSTLAVGFLLAVITMLMSMERRGVIQDLKSIGFYNVLLGYLRGSIYAWFVVAGFSILTALVNPQWVVPVVGSPWFRVGFGAWAFIVALGFLTSFRVARIMFALLRYGSEPTIHRPAGREAESESRLRARHTGSLT